MTTFSIICPKCRHVMNWNSWFQAYICEECDHVEILGVKRNGRKHDRVSKVQ
jgi:hypothetical protein